MRQLFKIILILICFNAFSQSSKLDLQKSGFRLNTIIVKNDTIKFISSNIKADIPKPTIIFLQGSKGIPILLNDSKEIFANIPFDYKNYFDKFNFVIINRKGIPVIGNFPKDKTGYLDSLNKTPINYIKHDNLKYRTLQAETVLNYLYKQKWVQKDSIYVIGHSEGYRVAAKLATKNKIISKLICMSADPFNRISETIYRERISCFNSENDSISQIKIETLITDYKQIDENIEQYKNEYNLYNWMSYEKDMPFENFKKFKNPILIVYGTNDIPSTHNDLLPFLLNQNNISLKVFSDYDHNYFKKEFDVNGKQLEDSFHWNEVFEYCAKWLVPNKQ
jgi:esterase/lipase